MDIPLRNGQRRYLPEITPVALQITRSAIAMPSVVWSGSKLDKDPTRLVQSPKLAIPPKLEITAEEQRMIDNNVLTLYDILLAYYSKRLLIFDSYNSHTKADLISRIHVRSLWQKVSQIRSEKGRWGKADLVNM